MNSCPRSLSLTVQVRYRRDHLSGRTLQHFPLLDDLLKDVCDGTALLAVIHFYCPELIRLEGTEIGLITDYIIVALL